MRAGRASDGAATGAVSRRLGLDLGRSGGHLARQGKRSGLR